MPVTFNKIAASDKYECDELYTPPSLVRIIKPFFDEWLVSWIENKYDMNFSIEELNGTKYEPTIMWPKIWLPFDTECSEFVKFFRTEYPNIPLTVTHLADPDGKGDFFDRVKYEEFDIVISNPPFSEKLRIFEELDKRNKPWALICNMMAINYQEVGEYFADHPVGFIIPDKKVSCNGSTSSFCLGYYCSKSFHSLPTFVHMENNNTKSNFVASEMMKERDEIIKKVTAIKEEKKKNGRK